jgi:hypothetical protein
MQYKLITMSYLNGGWARWWGLPITGVRFAVVGFNLPAIDPPHPCGILLCSWLTPP